MMRGLRTVATLTLGITLLTAPTLAHADISTIIFILGASVEIGGIAVSVSTLLTVATIAVNAYGAASARKKARSASAAARAAYNASLQDRSVTVLRSDPPWQIIYGRAIVGGAIADIFTTDKTDARREDGTTYTKEDALKTLVIIVAAHECAAIHEIYIDGIPLGTLDVNGYPTGSEFMLSDNASRTVTFTDTVTLTETPLQVLNAYGANGEGVQTVTISGNDLIGPAGIAVVVDYLVTALDYSVRVSKSLGSTTQPVNAYLHALAPTRYTTNHRLRGICYVAVTLNLLDPRFQGGPPNFTFDISGRLVYDPRTTTTAWSDNNALCARDFLLAEWGFNATTGDVDSASVIAAANACDVPITLEVGATTETGQPTYTCNGAFTTDRPAEAVLDDLADSMAGTITYGAQWTIAAGGWTPSVLSLADDDLHGQIELVQADTPMGELFNGLRGQIILRGAAVPTDMNPYSNATFVTDDGRELWSDIALPFTDHLARARNLSRIEVERNRAGQVIRYPAKLKAWPLQIGDRVTVTSAEYGLSAKTYRVTDWQFEITGAVVLTLQEDDASIWDLADAATADPTPNTNLPSPWLVGSLASLAAASGGSHVLTMADGTEVPRVSVTWAAVIDSAVVNGGWIEVQWRGNGETDWHATEVPGGETQAYLIGAIEGDRLLIRARARNTFRARGLWEYVTHEVIGSNAAPPDVAGLAYAVKPYQVVLSWTPCPGARYAETELRVGASWAAGDLLWVGKANEYKHPRPANGTYTVWAVHRYRNGVESAAPQSISVTVDDSIDAGGSALLWLQTSSFPAFVFDSVSDTTSDSPTITFTARLIGMTGTASWVAEAFDITDTSLGTLTLGGSGNVRTMDATLFNSLGDTETRYVDVTASRTIGSTTYSDTVRVYRADAASTLAQLYLENPYAVVPADAAGANEDFTNAETLVDVYVGTTGDTGAWSIAISADPGITATIDGGAGPVSGVWSPVVAITAMSVDVGAVEITATKGSEVLTRYFRAVKVRAGGSAYMHYLDPLQSIVLPVDLNGTVTSYAAAHTNAVVKQGSVDDTTNWTITHTDRNVTSSLVGTKISITSILEPGTFSSSTQTNHTFPPSSGDGWSHAGALLYDGTAWVRTGFRNTGAGYHHVQRSTDLVNWTNVDTGVADTNWFQSASMDGRMLLLSDPPGAGVSDAALVSTDGGQTWTPATMPASVAWLRVASGDQFVVSRNGSTTAYRSPTGLTGSWISCTMPTTSSAPYFIAPGRWAAVDSSGGIHTSADNCATWADRTAAIALGGNYVYQAHGFRGLIVAFFSNTTTRIAVSADNGATWTNVTAAASYLTPRAVRTIRDVIYMVGNDGKVHWSADGYKWRYSGEVVPTASSLLADKLWNSWSGRDLQIDTIVLGGDSFWRVCHLAATADGTGYVRLHFAKGAETLPDLTLPVSKGNIVSTVYSVSAYPAAVQLPATSDGVVTDYAAGTVTARADKAGSDDTANWLWTWVASAGITPASGSSNVATITAMSSAVDTGSITFTATKAGETARYGTIPVSKLKGSEPSGIRQGAAFTPFSASDTYIALRFKGTGEYQIKKGSGGSWVTAGQWVIPLGASNATTYWLKVDTSGHALDGASSATGTWLAMTSDRDYILSDAASGTHYTSLEVYFATSSGGAGAVRNIGELRLQVP